VVKVWEEIKEEEVEEAVVEVVEEIVCIEAKVKVRSFMMNLM